MALFKRKISLPMQVVIALVLGVVVGLFIIWTRKRSKLH